MRHSSFAQRDEPNQGRVRPVLPRRASAGWHGAGHGELPADLVVRAASAIERWANSEQR